ncbi:M23 family metallopeptidase [Thermovenabulum gondwanense]|uniref:Stage II sporulation protein Q n=1 Tax=Thermovenabulum gondwanense TaxID=520767 RepID=A0A161PW85_9FIRM|nr:M23 family metallopeptidase [Thermovenabulum gondwanense]KYO65376.1 Stage II sporulation protein Q [Thermovenabulum gondwanense]
MAIFNRIRIGNLKNVKRFFRWPSLRVGILLILLIILFTANGILWYLYYFSNKEAKESKLEEPQKQWEISLNENPVDESKLREEYSLNTEEKKEDMQRQSLTAPDKNTASNQTASGEKKKDVELSSKKDTEGETAELKVTADLNVMSLPVTGKIVTEFSKDTLVYSKTLNQWCAHKGVDIQADLGTPVKAALAGTVVEVKTNDPALGVVVVIDHGNGVKTLYGNLMSDKLVKKGMKVKKGDIIGGVGNTAPYESEDPPHLHFEVIKNNESIDPQQFFKNI